MSHPHVTHKYGIPPSLQPGAASALKSAVYSATVESQATCLINVTITYLLPEGQREEYHCEIKPWMTATMPPKMVPQGNGTVPAEIISVRAEGVNGNAELKAPYHVKVPVKSFPFFVIETPKGFEVVQPT